MLKENNMQSTAWNDFKKGRWQHHVDVREFIQLNYTLYEGDDQFLESPTEATTKLWDQVMQCLKKNVNAVVCGTWTQKSLLPSLLTRQVI